MDHISPYMQAMSKTIYWGKLRIILDLDGTMENLIGKSLACKNIFIDILVVQVTSDSLMMYQLHELAKRMDLTLRSE